MEYSLACLLQPFKFAYLAQIATCKFGASDCKRFQGHEAVVCIAPACLYTPVPYKPGDKPIHLALNNETSTLK